MSWQHDFCELLGGKLAAKKMEQAMVSLIREMLETGCDPNENNRYDSPVWTTLLEDDEVPYSVIKLLLDNGATLPADSISETPVLFTALSNGIDHKIIELLIERGADASFVSMSNETALQIACRTAGYGVDTIKLLIDHKSPLNLQKEDCGNSPLGNAALFDLPYEVNEYLISAGADIHAEDTEGNTPLMRLCNNILLSDRLVQLFIDSGADLKHKNHEGYSTLGILCQESGETDIMEILLDSGMDIHAVENGFTYPLIAASYENWDAVQKLLELGFSNTQILHPETGKSLKEIVEEQTDTFWDGDTIKRIKELLEG